MRFALGIAAGMGTLLVVAAIVDRDDAEPALPEYWAAPAFELIDQAGNPLGRADLEGKVWIAGFIFTHCPDVCPRITGRMARLADELHRERVLGEQVRLVSFTVDPERDSPTVLAQYARGFGDLPPAEWAFLTGVPGDSMRALIQQGFHLTAMKPDADHGAHGASADTYDVMHAPRVLLIDRTGKVRGIYDATDAESMNDVVPHALALLGD